MNTKAYVESLFKDYEESAGLKDFMEELQSNLDARIASLVRKGIPEDEAFQKACVELGDISALADELSLKKRREVFEDSYLNTRKYMKTGRVVAYLIFGSIFLFGFIISAITFFATNEGISEWNLHISDWDWGDWHLSISRSEVPALAALGALMPFLVTSIGGFTFLGLTQETKSLLPLNGKRAAWYTTAAVMISFGLMVSLLTYFGVRLSGVPFEFAASIAVLVPFVLPGCGILIFLVMTEKTRLKKWASVVREDEAKQNPPFWAAPADEVQFKLYRKALWIFTAAAFILLESVFDVDHSWLVFIVAAAVQTFMKASMMKKKP